jgi:hypothetical protein
VIFADLVADYNQRLDLQILTGSGSGANAKGILSDTNRISVMWIYASPTVKLFGNQVADAQQQIFSQIYRPPTHLILHPRRWAWILAANDTTDRPLVVPQGSQTNAPGTASASIGEGSVGVFQNLQVVLDANVPTNLGAGTNQDAVIVTAAAANYLWELPSGPVLRVYEEVLSGNLAVRLQVYSYYAFSSELRSKANAEVIGTGLVGPDLPRLMEDREASGILDFVELEAANYARACSLAKQASSVSERISWLSAAVESAFGACELVGRLREFHPDAADNLCNRWRDAAADLSVRRAKLVEERRAELADRHERACRVLPLDCPRQDGRRRRGLLLSLPARVAGYPQAPGRRVGRGIGMTALPSTVHDAGS